jgi:acetyl-CoA C-acetyltransferase
VSGLSPEIMGLGPVEATRKALKHGRHDHRRHRPLEINEAFAVQVIGSAEDLGMDSTSSTSTAAPSPSATRSA